MPVRSRMQCFGADVVSTHLHDLGNGIIETSTVKSHVASILAKLDLRDRVQAAVAAYEAASL